jgi:hypothetical protein
MDIATLTSIASAIAALLAALYAASSARSASKSLRLMQMNRNDKERGLQMYLIDSILWTEASGQRGIAMACTLTNLASVPNSVAAAELHVFEYQTSGTPIKLILRPGNVASPVAWDIQRFPVPTNLDPRGSVTGWLSFKLPEAFGPHHQIDKCELSFRMPGGDRVFIEQYLLKELEYVQNQS